jgi:hypothetical protein
MTGGRIIDAELDRQWQRRRAADRREVRARELGSSGPAGPCRRIDPQTGEACGEIVAPKARGIAPAAPVLGAPALGVAVTLQAVPLTLPAPLIGFPEIEDLRPATARKRAQRARADAGDMLISGVLDEDLHDELARLNWFIGIDASDGREVGEAILRGLRKDLLGE